MAWNIVRHAFVIVFGNFGNALRASAVPFLILGVFSVMSTAFLGVDPIATDNANISEDQLGTFMLALLVGLPLYLFVLAWVAVTWHRFILLEDYPANVPTTQDRPIWPYVGRSLMLMLQLVPVFFLVGLLASAIGMDPTVSGGLIMTVVIGTLISFFWFRIGVSLPAVAIGAPMNSRAAWAATAPVWQTILGVSVIVVVLNILGTFAIGLLVSGVPVIAFVVNLAVQWVTVMVSVSILTTLYGHVVEGRPLSGA